MSPTTTDEDDSSGPALPPHSIGAEEALLGAAMLSPAALDVLAADTTPDDFYKPAHRLIAEVLLEALAEGWTPDPVSAWDRLTRKGYGDTIGGRSVLVNLQGATPATTSAPRYARIVHDYATLRRLLGTGREVAELALANPADVNDAVVRAQALLDAVAAKTRTGDASTLEVPSIPELLLGDLEPIDPDYLTRTDGGRLIYAGRMHFFQAEPSSGKTWLALVAVLEALEMGGDAVYVDYEDSSRGILGRLLALGAEPAAVAARFHYVQPVGPFGPAEKARLASLLAATNPEVVVIDGVAEALSRDGLSEDKAPDFMAWAEKLPRWITRTTGAAVIMLDHVVKSKDDQGRWARGTGAKLAVVDGASYQIKVASSFSRQRAGTMKVIVAKDRPGGVGSIGETAAIVTVAPKADGARVVVTVDPDSVEMADSGPWRPTRLMEAASKDLESSAEPLTPTALKAIVAGKPRHVEQAIALLIKEGYVHAVGGKSKTLRSLKPFRADGDPGPAPPVDETPDELPLDQTDGNVIAGPWKPDPDNLGDF